MTSATPTPRPDAFLSKTFRSLRRYNYRLWATGAFVSNVGTWMQRIAQDWLVLTQLTPHSGTAVGIVMSLQFGPPIALMPWAGRLADRVDHRKILLVTQSALACTALGLGLLVVTGWVTLWHVYLFAGLTGCIAAFDAPVRQIFAAELVGDEDLSNAVALNSMLFNSARFIGPAVAGVVIALIGTGWLFFVNALSFAAVIAALLMMRPHELRNLPKATGSGAGMLDGLRYVRHRPDLVIALTMLFIVGTYGLNFPIFIATMSVTEFQGGPDLYGALASTMALGSVIGALLAARRESPRVALLVMSALAFGLAGTLAALMPKPWTFGAVLLAMGVSAQTFTTSANSLVQLRTQPAMRGRVMALYMAIFLGCTPLGAPMVGWVADVWGPRWALGVGAASGFAAAAFALAYHRYAPGKSHSLR